VVAATATATATVTATVVVTVSPLEVLWLLLLLPPASPLYLQHPLPQLLHRSLPRHLPVLQARPPVL
jgi:hypothetical protein